MLPAIFLLSCRNNQDPLPATPDDNPIQMVYDSIEVDGGTLLYDSVLTSFTEQVLAGAINDPRFGKAKAIAYFQLLPVSYPATIPNFNNGFTLDSVRIFFLRSTYYPFNRDAFPDEVLRQTLEIYPLLAAPSGSRSYYSMDTLAYDKNNKLATTQLRGIDKNTSTFIMAATGEKLLQLFKEKFSDKVLNNDRDVLAILPGVAVTPADSTDKLFSLRVDQTGGIDDVLMKMNFTGPQGRDSIFFALKRQSSVYFTHFRFDRSNTAFAAINQANVLLPAEASNGLVGNQRGSGLRSWINFTNLQAKKQQIGNVSVLKGELEIIPENPGSFTPTTFIQLIASTESDYFPGRGQNFNQLLLNENVLTNIQDTTNLGIRSNPSNFLFAYDANKKRYICNITGYLRRIMNNPQLSRGILVNTPFAATGFDGFTYRPRGGVKVKLFYKKPGQQ